MTFLLAYLSNFLKWYLNVLLLTHTYSEISRLQLTVIASTTLLPMTLVYVTVNKWHPLATWVNLIYLNHTQSCDHLTCRCFPKQSQGIFSKRFFSFSSPFWIIGIRLFNVNALHGLHFITQCDWAINFLVVWRKRRYLWCYGLQLT